MIIKYLVIYFNNLCKYLHQYLDEKNKLEKNKL